MSEVPNQTPSSANETLARLSQARDQSRWYAWSGLGLAFLWWVAAGAGAISMIGMDAINAAPPLAVVAGVTAILLPGLMMVLSGLLAREHARGTAANAVVLEAAARLLSPADTLSGESTDLAGQMVKAADDIDRTMAHALSAIKAMANEMGDERARLESVTYASADNARELAERLGSERNGLEQLAKDLREQSDLLNKAIPEQANMMVKSARAASDEVASAEDALQTRLTSLDQTGRGLAQKIAAMDTLAAEAGKRNETLLYAIARMEEKMESSRKTIESAARAGELAAAAAGTTGDRLIESVKSALDGAKEASSQIQRQTFEASESAARALAELKEAGQQAAAAVRAAGLAARAEMDIAGRKATHGNKYLFDPEPQAASEAEETDELIASEPEPEAVSDLHPDVSEDETPPVSPSQIVEEDLFEASADRMAKAMLEEAGAEMLSEGTDASDDESLAEAEEAIFEESHTDKPKPRRKRAATPVARDHSLSDIIADMEREDKPQHSREETAERLLTQLADSGIQLTDIFRPKDKKKIAFAARKGESQRRTATQQQASRQVERVRQRLRGNEDLMTLARYFLELEADDALNALENTHGSNKNASPRLATYLLVDAAVG